jgi:hypothetical protein
MLLSLRGIEFRTCLLRRYTWFETGDGDVIRTNCALLFLSAETDGQKDIGPIGHLDSQMQLSSAEEPQVGRRNSGYFVWSVIEENLPADDARVRGETAPPKRIAENDYVRHSALLFRFVEPPAELGLHL